MPPFTLVGHWSPTCRQFALGGGFDTRIRAGLWIYDLDTSQVRRVLRGQATHASWASDGSKLAISMGPPFYEIWVADLDPNIPAVEALGPGQTIEEYYQVEVSHYTRVIEAHPEDAESYFHRARFHRSLGKEAEALADMNEYAAILNPPNETNPGYRRFKDVLTGLWRGTPTNLGAVVNSSVRDGRPSISDDGLFLYFDSPRSGGHGRFDIWMTTRPTKGTPWGTPVNLGRNVNSASDECVPNLSADGLSLYFSSNRSDGWGGNDIWVTRRETLQDEWGEPENLGPIVNSSFGEWGPSISADGLFLHFSSNRPGGYGLFDMWVTKRRTDQDPWGEPENLGPSVNSRYNDYCPSISHDGLLLFFASVRPTTNFSRDLWIAMRATTNDPWGPPVNLGPMINSLELDSDCCISAGRSTLYFMSNRPGGSERTDLWQVPILAEPGNLRKDGQADPTHKPVEGDDGKEVMP